MHYVDFQGTRRAGDLKQASRDRHRRRTSSWEKNDEAAAEFCHGIYVAVLNDMKNSLE